MSCIYRRTAFAAASLDVPSDYAFDVFKQLDTVTDSKRIDFISLVQFARRYRKLSALHKETTVLSQGYFPPTIGAEMGPYPTPDYSPWVEMLDRWTSEFLKLVNERTSVATKKSLR